MSNNTYSPLTNPPAGTTATGLDQLVKFIVQDPGLAGANQGANIATGAIAADKLNNLILEAARAQGVASQGVFTASDVVKINQWIRTNRLQEFTELHGDDEGEEETGFHLVQNNGAIAKYQGLNLVDTVADGIYHVGFEIQNGVFVNEDGAANASVEQVAKWLTQFFRDRATTNTGLDRITELIIADQGLSQKISWTDIAAGADAASGLNSLYQQAIAHLNLGADGQISEADIIAINSWIRSDKQRYDYFIELHGDDEGNAETGFHLVQNDGANTTYFGKNLV